MIAGISEHGFPKARPCLAWNRLKPAAGGVRLQGTR